MADDHVEEILVTVSSFWLTVHQGERELFSMSVGMDHTPQVSMPAFDEVEFHDFAPPLGRRLRVIFEYPETPKEEDMGLPRHKREEASIGRRTVVEPAVRGTTRKRRISKATEARVERVGENDRDALLNAMIDFAIEHPDAHPSDVRDQTVALAEEFGLTKMQVAAVRANLTRGSYGKFETLKRQRQRSVRTRR